MINIESTMEKIARIYSGKDISIQFGPTFATDAKGTIYVPPISDQADPWVRFETEVATYHEMGHIRRYKNKKAKTVYESMRKNQPLHKVWNAIEDVSTDGELLCYPGIKIKQKEFLQKFVQKSVKERFADPNESALKKILDYTYLRAKEYQLGIKLDAALPANVKAVWDQVVGDKLAQTIATETDPEKISDISKQIFEKIKDLAEKEPQQQNGDGNESQDGEGQEGDDNSQGSSSNNDSESSNQKKSKSNKNSGSGKSGKSSHSKAGQESGSGDNDDGKEESKASNKSSGSGDDNDSPAQQDSPDEGAGDDKSDSAPQDGKDSSGGNKASSKDKAVDLKQQKKLQKQAKDLMESLENGEEPTTLNDDVKTSVQNYLDTNHVYREIPGLKEEFYQQDPVGDVSDYESKGREMTGYIGAKLRTLLVSDRAPKWFRCQRSGRLDVRKLWVDHTDAVYKKRLESRFEDSAVFMVMDNSGSMSGYKGDIASSLMTAIASELDKLRVPFAAAGFTSRSTMSHDAPLNDAGIRTRPSIIQVIKGFDEPYRRVSGRFRWPSESDVTVEFPCIKFGAQQLSRRRETKKILFVFSDGETASGNSSLDQAMRKAMKEYVKMLIRSEIFVVGFEIDASCLAAIIPTTIHINSREINTLPSRFYKELLDILLLKKGM